MTDPSLSPEVSAAIEWCRNAEGKYLPEHHRLANLLLRVERERIRLVEERANDDRVWARRLDDAQAERDAYKRNAPLAVIRRAEAAESRIVALTQQVQQLTTLAREATNGWACFAKRKSEHDEIARLHDAIRLTSGSGEAEKKV